MPVKPEDVLHIIESSKRTRAAWESAGRLIGEMIAQLNWIPDELEPVRTAIFNLIGRLRQEFAVMVDEVAGPTPKFGPRQLDGLLASITVLQDQRDRDMEKMRILRSVVVGLTKENMGLREGRIDEAPTWKDKALEAALSESCDVTLDPVNQ